MLGNGGRLRHTDNPRKRRKCATDRVRPSDAAPDWNENGTFLEGQLETVDLVASETWVKL
jgi:hypothetical protein